MRSLRTLIQRYLFVAYKKGALTVNENEAKKSAQTDGDRNASNKTEERASKLFDNVYKATEKKFVDFFANKARSR